MKIGAVFFTAFLVFAVFFSASVCPAEDRLADVVHMNDGSAFRGTILQLNTNRVTIETLEGEKVIVKFDDVRTFKKEPLATAVEKGALRRPTRNKSHFLTGTCGRSARKYTLSLTKSPT